MRLILLSEESIRLDPGPGPLAIEAAADDLGFSPFHMIAGGLALCTYSVMHAWADAAGLDADDLTLEVAWTFADDPHRVGAYDVRFNWPSLPQERLAAAERVADMCTVHATLRHPPEIRTVGTAGPPVVSDREQADGVEPVIAA